ncbi:hypothetical protein B4064_2105 [Caldibacillus thermoamylovorans]|nr:hypothetical protein B4064_2105 [Caldibacillus thermoamylovorans]
MAFVKLTFLSKCGGDSTGMGFCQGSAAGIQSFILGGAELEAARTVNESILSA